MESEQPTLRIYTRPIVDDTGESTVYLSITRYSNAIQAALYDKKPKLGSMTLAYPDQRSIERQTIFRGKHDQLSAALSLLLVRQTSMIVYASVNLSAHAKVTNELIREMITEYAEEMEN